VTDLLSSTWFLYEAAQPEKVDGRRQERLRASGDWETRTSNFFAAARTPLRFICAIRASHSPQVCPGLILGNRGE